MVLDKSTRLRIRRTFRRRQKLVQTATTNAGNTFEDNFFGRLERLFDVQRFIIGWVFLLVTATVLTVLQTIGLGQYYLRLGPVAGGIFQEGMVGVYSNANPIYATGPVDTNISRLVFAGLFKFDNKNRLIGDLATKYDVDESGRTYTVHLNPKATWHDGAKLTSKDVVFTYKLIQNPDAKSPLLYSWQGITVSAPNEKTVVFKLPNALTAFPYSLTNGIVPEHILKKVPAQKLRADRFNTSSPVGAGPFRWNTLQLGSESSLNEAKTLISLKPFDDYIGGKPLLDGFVIHVYEDEDALLAAYASRTVQAITGLSSIPKEISNDSTNTVYNFSTTAANYLFFKISEPPFNDSAVRKALIASVDQNAIIRRLGVKLKPVKSPLLRSQTSYYNKAYEQRTNDIAKARTMLDEEGWKKGPDGVRSKDNRKLILQVTAEDTQENHTVLSALKEYWSLVGAQTAAVLLPATDFQSSLETHSYSALLYGVSIGPDPDVFVYWDSSQSDPRSPNRLNFSEYKSATADSALEAGRTRQDVAVRAVKYESFLKAWQEDAPALGLYQPNSLYVSRGKIAGLTERVINTDADRYYSVSQWSIKTGNIPKF